MANDRSPGDRQQPYATQGGPQTRHEQTHDVRRERHTNPRGPMPDDPSFAEQLAPVEPGAGGGHSGESVSAVNDKRLHERLRELENDELARLSVLEPGARLEQGGIYLDLNRLDEGPFKAIGGQQATPTERYIAKRDTDYMLWNRLAGEDADVEIERPVEAR